MTSRHTLGLALLFSLALSGCPDAHGRDGDAGSDGGIRPCTGEPPLTCVEACGSDVTVRPVCSADRWSCPPGSVQPETCGGTCPAGLDPRNPADPLRVCSVEGSTCSSGSQCGVGLFCTCRSGLWDCAIAEPDPVCACGREPSEGDPCSEDGATCGECCPTPGGTGWAPMACVAGRWSSMVCTATCPVALECPADTASLIGRPCAIDGASCGDPCCSSAVTCEVGVWARGPEADCFACLEFACGTGHCNADQACHSRCGPTDGIEFVCLPLPSDCRDCGCVPIAPGQGCEMIDGHPHVSELGFCG